ncbi:hypothetical protein [Spirosoma utsteinense]|uniref:Type 1 periplasmic binding fold superfamily protein n=1 Tax=Spirosoma utsteinense TaxID=2585773 RepID=A0ABR6VZ59_9BACT|nr:hypothetical protein [Spirosoma utsteinense]MBC3784647.1 hypothetical protein [Spirosoma utsteinense]MBC3789599.1 hypothetical protein [Spirosoma utsteinense]
MNLLTKSFLLLIPVAMLAGACNTTDEENVTPTDDNEAITTATLTLTSQTTPVQTVTATIENLNTSADLTNATLNLRVNTTYTGAVTLLDKTKTPTLDVSAEVKTEGNEHLLVYTFTPATGSPASLTVMSTDTDTNPAPGPYPIGLTTQVRTGAAGSGKLRLVLRHQPNAKNGTAAPGTSDLDTEFNVLIN